MAKEPPPLPLRNPQIIVPSAVIAPAVATMEVACPHCTALVRFPAVQQRQAVSCPKCTNRFRLPQLPPQAHSHLPSCAAQAEYVPVEVVQYTARDVQSIDMDSTLPRLPSAVPASSPSGYESDASTRRSVRRNQAAKIPVPGAVLGALLVLVLIGFALNKGGRGLSWFGSGSVTKENYHKVDTGMSKQAVLKLLGTPEMQTESDTPIGKIEILHYQMSTGLGAKAITITIRDGIVQDKQWTEL